ncbi:MAG: hypothetical protein IJM95_09825 [Anaerotignum sp.]|nr:hypothetical protein [Anaerotignum sp.]
MYRFDIKEISKEAALEMIQKYHYSNTLPKINKHFLGFFLDSDEYSCAVKPPIRQTGNRLSGLTETAKASLLA